nr:hypothetical protein [Mycoplasmopsis bovis]
MLRDYDGIYNDIYATDVTYIPSPIDVDQNFVYMSAVIHHKTKKILGFNPLYKKFIGIKY